MKSRTKTKLDIETVEILIKKPFGGNSEIRQIQELTDGAFNSSFSAYVEPAGHEVIMKVSPSPHIEVLTYEKNIMKTEVEVLDLLRMKTDIPVPDVFAYDFSRNIISSDYFIMSKFCGVPLNKIRPKLNEEELSDIRRQTGRYLAEMHKIKGQDFGYYSLKDGGRKCWRESFVDMITDVLDDGRKKGVKLPFGRVSILSLIEQKSSVLNLVSEPSLTYFDLWDGNIIIKKESGTYGIAGIIDAERAFWGDPVFDFVSVALFSDIEKYTAFIDGYTEVSGSFSVVDDNFRTRICMYKIYLYLIMVIETWYRNVGTSFLLQRAYAKYLLKKELKKLAGK